MLDCELVILEKKEGEIHFRPKRTLNYWLDPFAFDDEQLMYRYRMFISYSEFNSRVRLVVKTRKCEITIRSVLPPSASPIDFVFASFNSMFCL